MINTHLSIKGARFLVNGRLTYSEIDGCPAHRRGLLLNARFIQGVFDDKLEPSRFARFGRDAWDPESHTQELIDALPEWYAHGLRAITVGFQGGGPCFTIDNDTIENNPFGADGTQLDSAYRSRMDKVIRAADGIGMIVIVSYFYGAQTRHLNGASSIREAVKTASRFLEDGGYENVIIEIANEQDIEQFRRHAPIIHDPHGMCRLIGLARKESGGLPVGCSSVGNSAHEPICRASDVMFIHGNGCSRQKLYNLIDTVRAWEPHKPLVVNEDSQAIGNLDVCVRQGVSWGYYNNVTKQEPPADWSVTQGEDQFFVHRMARAVGICRSRIPEDDQYYLQGFEPEMVLDGKRWIRLASLYPEAIDFVEFYVDGKKSYTCYDEPFSLNFVSNWRQGATCLPPETNECRAVIHLSDGEVIERTQVMSA